MHVSKYVCMYVQDVIWKQRDVSGCMRVPNRRTTYDE